MPSTGAGSYDDDGLVVSYSWDFGDGETADYHTTTHAYLTPGTYTATLTVTDNRGATSQDTCQVVVHDTRADLVISSLAWDPVEPEERDDVTITATITNVGNGPTLYGFFVTFYIDGLYRGYQRANDLLEVGQSTDISFHWTATKGLHTLRVSADDIQNNILETNEDNNDASTNLTLQQIYFPDLVVEDVTCDIPAEPVSSEQPLIASATVANRGTADAFDFWVSLYLDETLVSRKHVNDLVVDETVTLTFQFDPAAGDHVLTAIVDDPVSVVLESDEDNNSLPLALATIAMNYPDLVAENLVVSPYETVLSDGTSFDLSATIANRGSVAVESKFTISYYLDGEFVGSRELSYLAAGASQSLAIQARATPGEHQATVVIDETNVVAESNEANNVVAADIPAVTILYPDLIVSNVTWVPMDVSYGDRMGFTCTVSNITVVSTLDTFVFALYVDDTRIAVQELPKLTGNSSWQFALPWTVTVSPDTPHTIRAVVDTKDNIQEEDETNNELNLGDGAFQVADNFVLEVEAVGGSSETFGQPIYTSDTIAPIRAMVSRGSELTHPVTPDDGVEVRITVILEGEYHFDPDTGEFVKDPDTVIFEDDLMTYDPETYSYNASIDLITFGTGNYNVRVVATDGVDSAAAVLNMTVIEQVNFTLSVDQDVYQRRQPVRITGTVTTLSGDPLIGEKIRIFISQGYQPVAGVISTASLFDESVRSYTVYTDVNGGIDFTWLPLSGDAGHYNADAFVISSVLASSGHAEWDIVAIDISPSLARVQTTKNSTYTKTFTIENLSDVALTGLNISLIDTDDTDNITAVLSHSAGQTINAGAKVPVTITVTIPETAPDTAGFQIVISTNEGPSDEAVLNFELLDPWSNPDILEDDISVGVNPGGYVTRTVTLINKGLGTMSGITLTAPSILPWVVLGGLGDDELSPGESTTFNILIAPGEDVTPGIYVDRIVATDGERQANLVLTVEISSATRGSVSFVLVNDVGQQIADAEITLVSRGVFTIAYGDGETSTYHNVYHAKSDASGIATIDDIPVGEYDYSIGAAGHEKVTGVVEVMPQSQAEIVKVTMTAVPLSYVWTVTPIIIEDTYEITLNLTFAAEIPKPEFAFLPPWVSIPNDVQEGYTDQIVIVNPSLVEIHNVAVEVVGADGITLSAHGQIGTMAPQSSVVIAFHIDPGDYEYLHGASTYFRVTGTYVHFDPVTYEQYEQEAQVTGIVSLVNPSAHKVRMRGYGEGAEEFTFSFPDEGDGDGEAFDRLGLGGGFPGGGAGTVTEVVKLKIEQEATLEREGFDAQLELTNGMDRELVGLTVSPRVIDEAGVDVTDRFFIVPPELTGVLAVDGSDNLGAYATMTGRWVLIPGEGLGGTDLDGKSYWVKAVMSYYTSTGCSRRPRPTRSRSRSIPSHNCICTTTCPRTWWPTRRSSSACWSRTSATASRRT